MPRHHQTAAVSGFQGQAAVSTSTDVEAAPSEINVLLKSTVQGKCAVLSLIHGLNMKKLEIFL